MLHAATPAHPSRGAPPPALLAGVIIIGLFLFLVLGIVVILALLGARERSRRRALIGVARAQVLCAGTERPDWSGRSDQELLDNGEFWNSMAYWYRESAGVDLDPRPPMPADEALQVNDGYGGSKMGTHGAHGTT